MAKRRGGPSYAGVQWVDVSQAMEDFRTGYPNADCHLALEPNGLGAFVLTVVYTCSCSLGEHTALTEEPWSEAKGRLQAFAYRSCIDTLNELEGILHRCSHGKEVHT